MIQGLIFKDFTLYCSLITFSEKNKNHKNWVRTSDKTFQNNENLLIECLMQFISILTIQHTWFNLVGIYHNLRTIKLHCHPILFLLIEIMIWLSFSCENIVWNNLISRILVSKNYCIQFLSKGCVRWCW